MSMNACCKTLSTTAAIAGKARRKRFCWDWDLRKTNYWIIPALYPAVGACDWSCQGVDCKTGFHDPGRTHQPSGLTQHRVARILAARFFRYAALRLSRPDVSEPAGHLYCVSEPRPIACLYRQL